MPTQTARLGPGHTAGRSSTSGSIPPQGRPAHVHREGGPSAPDGAARDRPDGERDVPVVALAGVDVPRAILEHLRAVAAHPGRLEVVLDEIADADAGVDVHLE